MTSEIETWLSYLLIETASQTESGNSSRLFRRRLYMERKCADTIGTVLVPWAAHFLC